jgi:shikimate dehydrogenase
VVLIGAGGAGIACAYVLQSMRPSTFIITDCVQKKARACARRFNGDAIDFDRVVAQLDGMDVVVNATPANLQRAIIPGLRRGATYYDINYTYRMMRRKGIAIVDGLRMLVLQGARSFYLWTGREMPVRKVLRDIGWKL